MIYRLIEKGHLRKMMVRIHLDHIYR